MTYLSNNNVSPVYYKGDVLFNSGLAITPTVNTSNYFFGFSSMGTDAATEDGIIITYFVRPNFSLLPNQDKHLITAHEVVHWKNAQGYDVQHSVHNGCTLYRYIGAYSSQTWVLGDIDHDGAITAADAQLILDLCDDYDITIYSAEYIGIFILGNNQEEDKIYIVTVSDVNCDGKINDDDAEELLDYYTTYIAGQGNLNTYTGLIGTDVGLFNEITVSFAS